MPNLISKLDGKTIKEYSVSSKFCSFSNTGCSLEGKFGSLTLDFSSFSHVKDCQLKFKRKSGNGLIAIAIGNETKNYNIISKVSETIVISLELSKTFNIIRPLSGIGNVDLVSVSLISDVPVVSQNNIDIKSELNKCNRVCIRSVNDRYFASNSSKISSGSKIQIETNPPGMFKQNGNVISFSGVCEIKSIQVGEPKIDQPPQLLQSISKASNILLSDSGEIHLDFTASELFENTNGITFVDGGMKIDVGGKFVTPNIQINKSTNYTLLINCNNISGNGKINVSITGTNVMNQFYYINSSSIVQIPFTTKIPPYNIEISRGDLCDGQILISKMSILNGDKISVEHDESYNINLILPPVQIKNTQIENIKDSYRVDILNYSTINAETYSNYFNKDISINLKPATYAMNSWVSKFANLFEGITVDSVLINGCKKQKSSYENSILLTDINNLLPYKKIMLEEFLCDLNENQINILKNTKVLFCTSLMNCQYLRAHGINKVLYVPKYWPYKDPSERLIQDDYNLFFARNISDAITLNAKHPLNKKLVIVGYRGLHLDCITYDEYIKYSDLLSLIYHSDCIIDLPKNIHYYSGLLDFCHIANKNIITSNHWLNVSKPQASVVQSLFVNNSFVPNMDEVLQLLSKPNNLNKNTDMESYNYNLKSTLMILAEE